MKQLSSGQTKQGQPQGQRLALFISLCLLFSTSLFSENLFAQSQAEIESEVNMGESDAAAADEVQTQARLKIYQEKEAAAKKDAQITSKINAKRIFESRAHTEQMRTKMIRANNERLTTIDKTNLELKEVAKLEKIEVAEKIKLEDADTKLAAVNKKREAVLLQLAQVREQIQKTKDEVQALNSKEKVVKSEVDAANASLIKIEINLSETIKWKNTEIVHITDEIKALHNEQLAIENKIRTSGQKIKSLQKEVSLAKAEIPDAKENLDRAVNLKSENDSELARLKKMKRSPASVLPNK